jgi:hypothetical protein
MLPKTNYSPTQSSQFRKVSSVALPILLDLRPPEFGKVPLPTGKSVTVPKIIVNEDHNTLPNKDNVRFSGQ